MKSLRVIRDFEQLGEIKQYNSILLAHRYHTVGEVDLNINFYSPNAELIEKNSLIRFDGRNDRVYQIKHKEIGLDELGKASENWTIKAFPLKAFLMQRITYPPSHTAYDNKSGSAETVMKHYVERNFITPDDPNRVFPNLVIAPDQERGPNVSWQSRFKNVAEELTEISLASGLGWEIYLDIPNQRYVFDVVQPSDRTMSQSVLPPVRFEPTLKTIAAMQYTTSDLNYKNFAYVAGPGEGIERIVKGVGTSTGANRYELFIDARDVPDQTNDDPPLPRPLVDIETDLEIRGLRELEKMIQEQYLEAQILTKSQLIYETDYFLGDIVTVRNKNWNVGLDARITELLEVHESGGYKISATFGNNMPTLIDKIKLQFQQISGEVRK
ncbi:siphovirus ReqiPepy6 Gp37-like family protein [Jeotgalibacillus aurantiacus]|uniref:siphovirus ReqiPepy6 Gp37-like family protein n=1 Tax=Jeotgalibacillus aurantiacus TaxID=2763266 RepID=UPI001D0B7A01|nr:siphovirus ReqiPepy6 Gp37-like family protein [Jeotgalibacillus aurantiacus]